VPLMPAKKPQALDVDGVMCTVGASGIINVGVNPGWPAADRYIVKVKPGTDDEKCCEKVRAKCAKWAVVKAHTTASTSDVQMNETGGSSATLPPAVTAEWFRLNTCLACGLEPANGAKLVKCAGCNWFFCDVPHCERRDSCPHDDSMNGDSNADDEAGAGLGCQCVCCQSRLPPPCFDCNSSPCYCPSMVGPGERWVNPEYSEPGSRRPFYMNSMGECVECPTPTIYGEAWHVQYAPWVSRNPDRF